VYLFRYFDAAHDNHSEMIADVPTFIVFRFFLLLFRRVSAYVRLELGVIFAASFCWR